MGCGVKGVGCGAWGVGCGVDLEEGEGLGEGGLPLLFEVELFAGLLDTAGLGIVTARVASKVVVGSRALAHFVHHLLRFRVSGFGFRVSGFGARG